jgi:hypothetical protein
MTKKDQNNARKKQKRRTTSNVQSAFHEKVPAGGVSAMVRFGGKVYWWVD